MRYRKRAKKLTYGAEIAIVRRFREYPDRAVGKVQRADGSRKALAIWPHRMPQGKKWLVCVTLDTRDSPQDIPDQGFIGSECRKPVAHRNRACDTLHPWMGYAGRNSETESAHPLKVRKDARPPSTVMSGLLYRFTDATAGKIFVRDASAFSIFCVYGKRAKPSPSCASHLGLVIRFCAHLLRSPSAYVPSARQAGPHAHSL